MGVEPCPLQELDDNALRVKVQELRTSSGGDQVLTRCFKLLIDRGLNKESATSIEIYQFIGDVFCTPDLPAEVLHYTCRHLLKRADHQLVIHYAVQQVIRCVVDTSPRYLLYNLDALMSMQKQQIDLPPNLNMIHDIYRDTSPDVSILPTTMTDEELQNTFLFHTYTDPCSSCRHCLRQTYYFWRHVYPGLRPEWMRRLHVRPEGLFSILIYQGWFKEDQLAYFRSLDVQYNEDDPWSLEPTIDTPFYFLQRTTKPTAKFHHLFQLFTLQAHFTAVKGEARNPYDRSFLGAKNKTQCRWSIAKLRCAARPMYARSADCGSSLTSCRKV